MTRFLLILSVVVMPVVRGFSQGSTFNQRDDQYRLLGLKRAYEAWQNERSEYERAKELHARNLLSPSELANRKGRFNDAEVNYMQSMLAVMFEQQYIIVEEAVKYQRANAQKFVRIRLANASRGGTEFQKVMGVDSSLYTMLQPDVIHNVYVSLQNSRQEVISQPYEHKVEALRFGAPVSLEFRLLQDVDALTVNMIYGSGTQRSLNIFLQKDESQDRILIQTEQFSQETDLGASATYSLALEPFGAGNAAYQLEVVNLPQQLRWQFVEQGTTARLRQIRFTENAVTRRANLTVYLPDRENAGLEMDKPVSFFVLAIPENRRELISNQPEKVWTASELDALGIGYHSMELIPRGVGRLMVKAPVMYHAVTGSVPVETAITLANEGSRRLDNIQVKLELPSGWERSVSPEITDALDIGAEKQVQLRINPPLGASVGKYEIRVKSSSYSNNQPIYGDDKVLTVEITAEANLAGTLALLALILSVAGGIVWFGLRLARR
jgi:uncharacterized membrane protein